ncbi:hypothetical protein DIPPA_14423 [Diplonema papillatum]|nr:hypothetical protein DIPPA_14423 [Diplonema papillatum]|eukprot:gene18320-28227_t
MSLGRITHVVKPQVKRHISQTELISHVRDWKEHHQLGLSMSDGFLKEKEKFLKRRYRIKVLDAEKSLKQQFRGLASVPYTMYQNELGLLMSALQHSRSQVEQEIMYIYQNTLVKRFRDPALSLTTTHVYFADVGSVMIVLNMQPRYAYGKICTQDGEVTIFDSEGRRKSYDELGVEGIATTLQTVAEKMLMRRRRTKRSLSGGSKHTHAAALQSVLGSENLGTHAVSFADCTGADEGGANAFDLPRAAGELQRERAAHKRAERAFKNSAPPAVVASDAAGDWAASELVRPLFSIFVEPFMHHMVPPTFVDLLPPSTVFKPRMQYIGGDHSRFMHHLEYMRAENNLIVNRSPYPTPDPSFLQPTQAVGGARSLNGIQTLPHWSTSRDTYDRPFVRNWDKGWTPTGFKKNSLYYKGAPNLWEGPADDNDDDDVVL